MATPIITNTNTSSLPYLILHFDINKTSIFGDSCQNISFESSLLTNITECSWGTINPTTKEWTLSSPKLSFSQPSPHLISYSSYLGHLFPNKTETDIPDRITRAKVNESIKQQRLNLSDIFLNKDQPGSIFKSTYDHILSHLKLPSEYIQNEYNQHILTNPQMRTIYKNGYRFLFFSLFNTMIKLTEQHRTFIIIFRTFGEDVDNVIYEFNLFCNGQHPLFNNVYYPRYYFNGTNGSVNYVIDDMQRGVMYRFSDDIRHLMLVMGKTKRISENTNPYAVYEKYREDVHKGKVKIINGGDMIYLYIMKMCKECGSKGMIIGDDYMMWFSNGKGCSYGKPMFVNPYDEDVVQVFFDDNVTKGRDSIVDCRNVVTERCMEADKVWERYVGKTDAIEAGMDEEYFVKWILKVEEGRKRIKEKDGKGIIERGREEYEREKDKEGVVFGVFLGNYIKAMMWKENEKVNK